MALGALRAMGVRFPDRRTMKQTRVRLREVFAKLQARGCGEDGGESGQTTAYLRAAIVCLPVPSEPCVSLPLQPPRKRTAVSGSVTYRDHELAVRMPSRPGGGWIVLIWRPNNARPIIMPRQPSLVAAVRAAQAVVNEVLDGRGCA
jgi:hypothetical protein